MTFDDCGASVMVDFDHPSITGPIPVLCHLTDGHDGPHFGYIARGVWSVTWPFDSEEIPA